MLTSMREEKKEKKGGIKRWYIYTKTNCKKCETKIYY